MARTSIACVVAIDFGTTYSGYAFSTVEQYKKNKLDINLNPAWNSGAYELVSCKTPTTLLLTKSGEFMSYGYTAERQYENILLDKNQDENDYLYFRRFKMELYSQKVSLDMKLKDVRDSEYPALEVFCLSTKALRDHCLNTLREQGHDYDEEEIKWSVTLPAIWSAEAKMFMRKACEQAGIPRHRLVIALEPEVASLYCQYSCNMLSPRTKYLVVDLGGGTADITAHEILKNGFFKQILHSTGNDCGGTSVDREFFNILQGIIGADNMNKFKTDHTIEYLELCSSLESVKRNIIEHQKEKVNITIPITCLDELNPSENFEKMLRNSKYADTISVVKNKMQLDPECAKSLFSKTIEEILSVITGILHKQTGSSISVILLVGGFSESKLVQLYIGKEFPGMSFIIPKDPTVAVLKGAVLFGHRPDVVTTRVTPCSYGRKIKPIFNPRIHENNKMVKIDGEPRCDGVFELLIKSGTSVPIGKTVNKSYHTVSRHQEHIRVALYRSSNDNTKYVDEEDCCLIGECIVPVLQPSDHRRNVTVQFEFGDTEIYITAFDKETKNTVKETFKLE